MVTQSPVIYYLHLTDLQRSRVASGAKMEGYAINYPGTNRNAVFFKGMQQHVSRNTNSIKYAVHSTRIIIK